jgi:RNA polymerase sigma factor (sigma-70 family)
VGDSLETLKSEKPRQKIVETVKEYGRRLFKFIRDRVRSDEDAEDILQEVWYQFSNTIQAQEIDHLSGWLFRVARNKIIDKHRKKTTSSLEDHAIEEDQDADLKHIFLADHSNPETEYLKEFFWQELMAALDELPENQRQVFIWNELEELTLQEIADKTQEPLKTIISRKGYAVKHLRRRLENLYDELMDY